MAKIESEWYAALENALRDAFDRMAMMDVAADTNAEVPADDDKSMSVTMALDCIDPTSIELRIPRALASAWSAAIAGVETSEVDSSETEDGGRELLNMIAGAAKTALGERGTDFDLGIPKVRPFASSSGEPTGSGDPIRLGARCGDHPIELMVRIG